MSRQAETEIEIEFEREDAAKDAACAHHFVVGATVYRARYDRVETGVVKRVSRCRIRGISPEECDGGEYPYYVAQFGSDWDAQTYAWRFFWDEAHARHALVEELQRRIAVKRREIQELEALAARTVAAGVSDPDI